jgi:hypothetical protein
MTQGPCEESTYREMFVHLLLAVHDEFGGARCSEGFQKTILMLGDWHRGRERALRQSSILSGGGSSSPEFARPASPLGSTALLPPESSNVIRFPGAGNAGGRTCRR